MMLIVRLFAAASVADDRLPLTYRDLRRILSQSFSHSVSSLCGGPENGIKRIVVDGALPPTLTCQDLSRKRSSFSSKSNRRKRIKHSGSRFL
jgi:hypothetical protein